MLLNLETFFGRFHPLIVHLPIGFLLLAVFFAATSFKTKYRQLRAAVPPALLMGTLSAAFACITGYVLSLSGDFDAEVLDDHFWAGIITTVVSFVAYLVSRKKIPLTLFKSSRTLMLLMIILFLFISITGHLGGSLTHGSDYLSLSVLSSKQPEKRKLASINDASVFSDLVQPILQNKCGNCHNSSKKKGKLSVETFEALMKGGKHGPAIKPGDVAESEIVRRISLNPTNKKFMPADGKPPLTPEETAVIRWWIEKAAAPADKKLVSANPPEDVRKFAAAYLGMEGSTTTANGAALHMVAPPASREVIENLMASGFVIKYLQFKPDLLDVTLPPMAGGVTEKLRSLEQVKDNIVWLNVSGNNVSDNDLAIMNQFGNLQRLKLEKNPISDAGLKKLADLKQLESLNLYNTRITIQGLTALATSASLKRVYVWNTGITEPQLTEAQLPFLVLGTEK
jgi:uncharacterized membrane protein